MGIPILLYWWLLSKCTKLSVSQNEILLEEGILSKTRSEVSINAVRTIRVHQTFFQRIFGVGRIEIYTAGDDPEIMASGLPSPNKVRDLIKKYQAV